MPTFTTIDDADDPRIAAYRDIRERDLVRRDGLFVAEGEVVVRQLVTGGGVRPVSLLLAEGRQFPLADALAGLPDDVTVHLAGRGVLDRIVGFPLHRGVLALGRRVSVPTADELLGSLGPDATAVVLVGVANHDNVGGIFRNAAAFGVDAVLLDAACCDPLYRKAIRVSVGAALTVPFARIDAADDPLDLLVRHGFTALALSPAGTSRLADLEPPRRPALLFGTEGPGLPAAVLDRAATLRIPMASGFDSLNVATSSGIVLHHLWSRRSR